MSLITSLIIIPSYKPDHQITTLVSQLTAEIKNFDLSHVKILVISDGNSVQENQIFKNQAFEKTEVIYHYKNLGKGRSLKTAINHALVNYPHLQHAVTADSDGQHSPKDILRLVLALKGNEQLQMVLGYREFDNNVPMRSLVGNKVTSLIFRYYVGLKIQDTQTGLRGFSKEALCDVVRLSGERFEFETNVLLLAKEKSWMIQESKIETVYIQQNKGSHFNPLFDSMKIYFLIFRFAGSSLISSVVDFFVFKSLYSSSFSVLHATLGSRFVSGWINFTLNKQVVFRSNDKPYKAMIRYWALVMVMGFLSTKTIEFLIGHGVNVLFAKIISETFLFIASFSIQKEFVFKRKEPVIIQDTSHTHV